MAEKTNVPVQPDNSTEVVDRVAGFWQQNSKNILIGLTAIIVIAGGIVGYKYLIAEPKERNANDAIFRAQQYFQQDSLSLALNGDATNPGFLKIMDKYSGTKAGNLSHFYAGAIYLRQGDYANAVKHLKDFSTSSVQINARAKALLADAYAEQDKKEEAAKLYREAAGIFEKDEFNSAEYLFRSASLYELLGKNKEAIEAYKIIKEKYPRSERGFEVDKYLARLGEL